MQTKIDIPFILETLRKIGDNFQQKFKKSPLPQNEADFYRQFQDNEAECLSFIKTRLEAAYPGIPFADGEFDFEEQERSLSMPEYWICDAMDGAIQYIQHLPGWTINLVLVRDGAPVFAAIYDPMQQEMFWAMQGEGAFMNDQRLKVIRKPETRLLLAAFDHPSSPEKIAGLNHKIGASVQELLEQFAVVRNYGPHGLQLAYVGAGRIDIFCQEGLDTYNWLPGILIAQEAGAQISTTGGQTWQWGDKSLFVAAPGVLEGFVERRKSGVLETV